jgi:hypothetical protein
MTAVNIARALMPDDSTDDMAEALAGVPAAEPLPGLLLRNKFGKQVKRSDRTLRKWEQDGILVVVDMGSLRYVDVPATLERLRARRRQGRSRE